jgi:hypothetical protein
MSLVLLPAIRRSDVNLYRPDVAGLTSSHTSGGFLYNELGATLLAIPLSEVGLRVGDVVSGSMDIRNLTATETVRMQLRFRNAAGSNVQSIVGTTIDSQDFVRVAVEGQTIPATTHDIALVMQRVSGTGTIEGRKGMVNRGAHAAGYALPRRGVEIPIQIPATFGRDGDQKFLRTIAGITQITSYPSRLWIMQADTVPLFDDELRDWELALDQLSDLSNVFAHVPPGYEGPGTDYDGPNPRVNGADQLGVSLDVDGLDVDSEIVRAGDYASVAVTSALSNANQQLFRIKTDVVSDGSGEATFTFTTPIRQAPADDTTVQIYSPTALFSLVDAKSRTNLQLRRMAMLSIAAEERIHP